MRKLFMHTACVWSEKLPFARYSVVKDHSGGNRPSESSGGLGTLSPDPLRSVARGAALRPAPLLRDNLSNLVTRVAITLRSRAGVSGVPARPARLNAAPSITVENTGLEPVTSWLQTRRSPS
jgi:hypothetical protein